MGALRVLVVVVTELVPARSAKVIVYVFVSD
jgi:hypothetical protein